MRGPSRLSEGRAAGILQKFDSSKEVSLSVGTIGTFLVGLKGVLWRYHSWLIFFCWGFSFQIFFENGILIVSVDTKRFWRLISDHTLIRHVLPSKYAIYDHDSFSYFCDFRSLFNWSTGIADFIRLGECDSDKTTFRDQIIHLAGPA